MAAAAAVGGREKKVSNYTILPPPPWKHRVRAVSLHILIMINAGSAAHIHIQAQNLVLTGFYPWFSSWGQWFRDGAVNMSGLAKVEIHKTVTKKKVV